jgi:hypothetical protein
MPGSLLSFEFGLTTNVDAGGTPDEFSLALLQQDGTVVNTADPSGANALLIVDIDSGRPTFNTFASDLTPAAIVTQSAALPEPPTSLLLAVALASAAWSGRRGDPRRRSAGYCPWIRRRRDSVGGDAIRNE